MSEFDPTPDTKEGHTRWQDGRDTFSRVYDVVLGLTTPTPYTEIASLADCSPNAAKKHLDRLVKMGIASTEKQSRPATYVRNDGYLEWHDASRIAADRSAEEIIDRVEELEARLSKYETKFDSTDPDTVSLLDQADHETIHDRMVEISEWRGIRRDIRLYELARQLAQNDGHLLPA